MVAPLATTPPAPRRRSSSASPDPHGLRHWLKHIHPDPWGWYVIATTRDWKETLYTPFQGHQIDAAIAFIAKKRSKGHVYVSLGTQAKKPERYKRGLSTDVKRISVIWIDIDTKGGVHSADNLPGSTQDALQLLRDAGLPAPSYVIHTGGGIQVYWFLDASYDTTDTRVVDTVEAVQWTVLKAAESRGWHVDQLADPARVFRAPGTLNFKTETPKEVRTLTQTDRTYPLAAFTAQLDEYDQDINIQEYKTKKGTLGTALGKFPSIEAFNKAHSISAMLERYGYVWDGKRMRHQDADASFAAGVAIYESGDSNHALHYDTQDPLHHNKSKAARSDPFRVYCHFEFGGDFKKTLKVVKQEGWGHEPAFAMPTHTSVSARYITTALKQLPLERAIIIKSPIGTGKTELLNRVISPEASVLVIGHRKNLLRNMANRLGLAYYEDLIRPKENAEDVDDITDCTRLAVCLDSIQSLSTRQQFDYVILDESEQVLNHACGRTVKDRRAGCLEYLRHFQHAAGQVIYLDADAGRITYEYARRTFSEDDLHTIVNEHQPADKTFIAYDRPEDLEFQMIAALHEGQKLAIATNSKETACSLAAAIRLVYPNRTVMDVHGHNAAEADVQDFIKNINTRVPDIDVLIYSPSLGTGVSIDVVHFDAVYLFGHGQPTTHRDMLQQCGRVRTSTSQEIHCWVAAQTDELPTQIDQLKTWCIQHAKDTGLIIGIDDAGDIYSKDDAYLSLWADVTSERTTSMNNLREAFYAAVREGGHTIRLGVVQDAGMRAIARAFHEAGKEIVFDAYVKSLQDAVPIEGHQAAKLRKKHTHTADEMAQLKQYDICLFYEITPDAITDALVKKDDDGLRRNAGRLAMIQDRTAARRRDEAERYNQLPDKSHHELQAQLREKIIRMIAMTPAAEADLPRGVATDLLIKIKGRVVTPKADMVREVLGLQSDIYTLLGMRVQRDVAAKPIQFIQAFLRQIGIKLHHKQRKVAGSVERTYYVVEAEVQQAFAYATRWLEVYTHTTEEVSDEAGR